MVSPELLEILRCPENHAALRLAPDALVAGLNAQIASGALQNRAGQIVKDPLQHGLLREDGLMLYPVRDDIPVLLLEEGIPLTETSTGQTIAG